MKRLSKQYQIPKGSIEKWRDLYLEHGIEGLCSHHGTYSGDFKISVVEYMHKTGASLRKTAAHFNILAFQTVSQWERIYYEEGKESLYQERKDRAKTMKQKRTQKQQEITTNEDLFRRSTTS